MPFVSRETYSFYCGTFYMYLLDYNSNIHLCCGKIVNKSEHYP